MARCSTNSHCRLSIDSDDGGSSGQEKRERELQETELDHFSSVNLQTMAFEKNVKKRDDSGEIRLVFPYVLRLHLRVHWYR